MKEVKFRVYDLKDKKIVYSDKLECFCEFSKMTCSWTNDSVIVIRNDKDEEVGIKERYSDWQQFTGLKDCKGKEIYEGDIVNYGEYSDNQSPCNFIVKWDTEHAGFSIEEIRQFGRDKLFSQVDDDCEVIGNIYENGDLLK